MKKYGKPKSKWTDREREFDHILNLMESPSQVARIEGRMRYWKFVAQYTEAELAQMAKAVGATRVER